MKTTTKIKKVALLLMCLPLFGLAQQTFIPDSIFESYLESNGMGNGILNDHYVTTSNISSVLSLDVKSMEIEYLTGIEDFTALRTLYCDNNNLTQLNVTNNINLQVLSCGSSCSGGGNLLTSLDVSNNINLRYLRSDMNFLSTLDLRHNPLLYYLRCGWNQLASIDLSNNPLLQELSLYQNNLTSIDLIANTELDYLFIGANQLSSLDLSNNSKIVILQTGYQNIGSLDVSNMSQLEFLSCAQNELSYLDVTNNPLLTDLHFPTNHIASIDVSNNSLITWMTADNNQLNTLDVSNLSELTTLTCRNNQLTILDLRNGNNINFVSQYPANPSLSPALDVRDNTNLTCINVDDASYSILNWAKIDGFFIDPQHDYDDNCFFSTDINEGEINNDKKVVRIIDILGKETTPSRNTPLFYIYDDGTVEKKIIIN